MFRTKEIGLIIDTNASSLTEVGNIEASPSVGKESLLNYLDEKLHNAENVWQEFRKSNAMHLTMVGDFNPAIAEDNVRRLRPIRQSVHAGEYKNLILELDKDIQLKMERVQHLNDITSRPHISGDDYYNIVQVKLKKAKNVLEDHDLPTEARTLIYDEVIIPAQNALANTERGRAESHLVRLQIELGRLYALRTVAHNLNS